MDTLLQDTRFGYRMLPKAPGRVYDAKGMSPEALQEISGPNKRALVGPPGFEPGTNGL